MSPPGPRLLVHSSHLADWEGGTLSIEELPRSEVSTDDIDEFMQLRATHSAKAQDRDDETRIVSCCETLHHGFDYTKHMMSVCHSHSKSSCCRLDSLQRHALPGTMRAHIEVVGIGTTSQCANHGSHSVQTSWRPTQAPCLCFEDAPGRPCSG